MRVQGYPYLLSFHIFLETNKIKRHKLQESKYGRAIIHQKSMWNNTGNTIHINFYIMPLQLGSYINSVYT